MIAGSKEKMEKKFMAESVTNVGQCLSESQASTLFVSKLEMCFRKLKSKAKVLNISVGAEAAYSNLKRRFESSDCWFR